MTLRNFPPFVGQKVNGLPYGLLTSINNELQNPRTFSTFWDQPLVRHTSAQKRLRYLSKTIKILENKV